MRAIYGCPPHATIGVHLEVVEAGAAAFAMVLRDDHKRSGRFKCPCCPSGHWHGTPEAFQCDTCDVGKLESNG